MRKNSILEMLRRNLSITVASAAAFFFASTGVFGADAVPDFTLKDVSYSSPRRSQPVSPRDYLLQVSAWYFGDAT